MFKDFNTTLKAVWSGFQFFQDEVLNFEFWGFGRDMRSNECLFSWTLGPYTNVCMKIVYGIANCKFALNFSICP